MHANRFTCTEMHAHAQINRLFMVGFSASCHNGILIPAESRQCCRYIISIITSPRIPVGWELKGGCIFSLIHNTHASIMRRVAIRERVQSCTAHLRAVKSLWAATLTQPFRLCCWSPNPQKRRHTCTHTHNDKSRHTHTHAPFVKLCAVLCRGVVVKPCMAAGEKVSRLKAWGYISLNDGQVREMVSP